MSLERTQILRAHRRRATARGDQIKEDLERLTNELARELEQVVSDIKKIDDELEAIATQERDLEEHKKSFQIFPSGAGDE